MRDSVAIRVGAYSDRIRKSLKFMNPKREEALAKAAALLHEAGWYLPGIGLAVEAVMAEHLSYEEGYRASVRRPREVLAEEATKIGFLENYGSQARWPRCSARILG